MIEISFETNPGSVNHVEIYGADECCGGEMDIRFKRGENNEWKTINGLSDYM